MKFKCKICNKVFKNRGNYTRHMLDTHGIDTIPSKEELFDLYWKKLLTLKDLERYYGVNKNNILNWFKKRGIPRRGMQSLRFLMSDRKYTPCKLAKERASEFEVGYTVALIEGEGTLRIRLVPYSHSDKTTLAPEISIINTELEMLERVKSIIGGRLIRREKTKNKKQVYRLQTQNTRHILQILEKIKDRFASPKKRKLAELLIEFCERRLKRINDPNQQIVNDEKDFEIYRLVKQINGRG